MAKTTGIRTRHGRCCRSRAGGSCNCSPSYAAFVFDRRALVHAKTCSSRQRGACDCTPTRGAKIYKSFPTMSAARGWRSDALGDVRRGKLRTSSPTTIREAWEE